MIGKLEYEDFDGLVTEIEFQHEDNTDQTILEFCGTGDPLFIKWAGERYSTTAPSSATLNLFIQTLEQRQFLEDVFNGGWVISVYKDKNPFWYGQITPTLGIETYRAYPYKLSLNCNDGIGDLSRKHFLMIDFPEPYEVGVTNYSILDVIIKLINKHLYPNGDFTINVSMRYVPFDDLANNLSDMYIDPIVFMENDKDEYIKHDELLHSLLGPFNLQLFQWKQQWWVVDLEAQWDNGTVEYIPYIVQNSVWTPQTEVTEVLGIFDLYSCDKENIEIGNSGRLDFIQPWRKVDVVQEFQLNNCILPTFANRMGNFYWGHTDDDNVTFVPLEFKEDYQFGSPFNLRHWDAEALVVNQWADNTKTNTGYAWVDTIESGGVNKTISKEFTIHPNIEFSKFFWGISTMSTYKDSSYTADRDINPFAVIEIKYTDTIGRIWYFWNNDTDSNGPFPGWTTDIRQFKVFDEKAYIESSMPDGSKFTGGTFTIKIYRSEDERNWIDYGMLINNFNLGLVYSLFENIDVVETEKGLNERTAKIFKDVLRVADVTQLWATTFQVAYDLSDKIIKNRNEKRANAVGGQVKGSFDSADFPWEDTLKVSINPNAETDLSYGYRFGLRPGYEQSYHEFHISSPYDSTGHALDLFLKYGGGGYQRSLMNWKGNDFIRDNTSYTTKLSGTYKAPIITPLQLIYDYEGRVYRFLNGTWNDRRGTWNCSFMEAKFVQIPGQPSAGDFNPFASNNDFSTLIPA